MKQPYEKPIVLELGVELLVELATAAKDFAAPRAKLRRRLAARRARAMRIL